MRHTMVRARQKHISTGSGLINSVIDSLPVEVHLPGYRFCGPGTKLKQRLANGEVGVNSLDELARTHDIAYDKSKLTSDRRVADEVLENQAWKLFKSKNTGLKEKAASWLVTTAMKAKRKLGAGGCGFKNAVKAAKKSIRNKTRETDLTKLVKTSIAAAKKSLSKNKKTKAPRIIPIPKKGGVLPLIPIFAGLSALGSLSGGFASVVRLVNEMRANKKASVHLGKGLYLTPHKGGSYKIEKGNGLYLKPYTGGSIKKKKTQKN